ncbi:hypothetical protein ACQ4M4_13630 [Leptolyngbya sp. AN02str]|uniref:hypothetical protein n=1 Tax=Leptolyngbya sp. AN02str TaxID=3423363 RepID=UPI003D313DF8
MKAVLGVFALKFDEGVVPHEIVANVSNFMSVLRRLPDCDRPLRRQALGRQPYFVMEPYSSLDG